VKTTFIQQLPWAKKKYRAYLPLMPLAIEQFDLRGYDLILSSSHAVAKGVITGPDQIHIAYIHSPMRYAWDLQGQYLRESGLVYGLKSWITRYFLHRLRAWDVQTSHGVDYFLSNSDYIGRRISKCYRREAETVYPGIDLSAFSLRIDKDDFYLTASRMVPYKKMDLIVEAFSSKFPDKKLVVIGEGPDFKKIKALAGPNVVLLGRQDFSVLLDHLQRAKAFVFAAEEDFGLLPLEAQACGTPVIAYGKGGALETVRGLSLELLGVGGEHQPTGLFFSEQSVSSLAAAIEAFESHQRLFSGENCRANAERFSLDIFHPKMKHAVMKRFPKAL
jgi:glycosyltransferase involved in cell wall biosynthesis